jgi:hypothetical protein
VCVIRRNNNPLHLHLQLVGRKGQAKKERYIKISSHNENIEKQNL